MLQKKNEHEEQSKMLTKIESGQQFDNSDNRNNFFQMKYMANDPNSLIWIKKPKDFVEPKEILLQGVFEKNGRNFNFKIKRCYFICDTCLYYKKTAKSKKVLGVLNYFPIYLEVIDESKDELQINPQDNRFGFRFIKNFYQREITTKNYQLFVKFKNILRQKFIQKTFSEDFEIIKLIGKGSFAQVFLAKRKDSANSDERFAVKVFKKIDVLIKMKGKGNILNEISVMRQLKHPNLLQLYEIYESPEYLYLILESLEGGELMTRILEKGTYDEYTLSLLMRKIFDALEYMHSKKIIHRDIKPENLLLRSIENDHDLVIADFGLATQYSEPEKIKIKRCGTPGFIAPEFLNPKENQDKNIRFTEKSDVYGVGIILYMLIVGKSPFKGKTIEEILSENKKGIVNFEAPELKKASDEVMDLLKGMLKVNLEERISIKQALDHRFFKLRMEEFKNISDILRQLSYKDYEELKKTMQKYGKENVNPSELPQALASFFGSSLFLNIHDNALKGQIQSYLSNSDSTFKLPSLDISLFKKNEMKNNEKIDILEKYVKTEENKIEENSLDKEYDLESGIKSDLIESISSGKIPNENSKIHMRKNSADDFRKKAIYNQMLKNQDNKQENKNENLNIKLSKV